ncbi:hypothetical protein BY458DRAFT_505492 [Sporodiniella umbellata]|nr:hypothetical protein BY458DRAFT_505492 [Sporodiniella umbellata]
MFSLLTAVFLVCPFFSKKKNYLGCAISSKCFEIAKFMEHLPQLAFFIAGFLLPHGKKLKRRYYMDHILKSYG